VTDYYHRHRRPKNLNPASVKREPVKREPVKREPVKREKATSVRVTRKRYPPFANLVHCVRFHSLRDPKAISLAENRPRRK
jgi:hypothetical protein